MQRKDEREFVLAIVLLPFLLAFLIWFAVPTDNVLLGIGVAIGSVIGSWWCDKRKARRLERAVGQEQ